MPKYRTQLAKAALSTQVHTYTVKGLQMMRWVGKWPQQCNEKERARARARACARWVDIKRVDHDSLPKFAFIAPLIVEVV